MNSGTRKHERTLGRWGAGFRCVGRSMRAGWVLAESRNRERKGKPRKAPSAGRLRIPGGFGVFVFCGLPPRLRASRVPGAHKQFTQRCRTSGRRRASGRLRGFAVRSRFRDSAISGRRTDEDARAARGSPPATAPFRPFVLSCAAVHLARPGSSYYAAKLANALPTSPSRRRLRARSRSWRTRSRVTPSMPPISSSVCSRPPSRPK